MASDSAAGLARLESRVAWPTLQVAEPGYDEKPFSTFERIEWIILAALSTIIVCVNDGLTYATGFWLFGIIGFGQVLLPRIYRLAHDRLDSNDNLYLGVAFGWALVPGPFVGILFGVLLPCVYNCGLSSFSGGIIGLLIGPCFAMLQGLVIVSLVDTLFWLTTRRRLIQQTT